MNTFLSNLFLSLSVVIFMLSIYTYGKSATISKMVIDKLKKRERDIEIRTKAKFNKFIVMDIKEFEAYLAKILAISLELASITQISENDPKAKEKLHATALIEFVNYFADSLEYISFYYGSNYLMDWYSMQYRLLEAHRDIDAIVSKTIDAKTIESRILK